MSYELKDKVAVVTGAGGTFCSEMARNLAAQGYAVALLGRTLDKLKTVEEETNAAVRLCSMKTVVIPQGQAVFWVIHL